jgi:ribosomal protein S12 methylthiotransferase accessory factor
MIPVRVADDPLAGVRSIAHEDGGIITSISVHNRPLWFSPMVFATVRGNAHSLVADQIRAFRGALGSGKVATAQAARKSAFTSSLQGSGIAFKESDAVLRAVGEAVERYAAKNGPLEAGIVRATFDELAAAGDMIPLERWNHAGTNEGPCADAADARHRIVRLEGDTRINWMEARSLATGKPWLAPTSHVLFGSFRHLPADTLVAESISTGLASHSSYERAVMSGLCEVVERDAFMGMWAKKLRPSRLSRDSLAAVAGPVRDMVTALERTEFRLEVNDLTPDSGIPVFLATLVSGQPPYAIVGAGCHPDPDIALEKAIAECYMSLVGYAIFDGFDNDGGELRSDTDVVSMHDHGKFYRANDLNHRLAFYLEAPVKEYRREDHPPAPANADALVHRLVALGYDPLVHDLTTPEIRKAGWHVVKVLVPGLLPLYCREFNKPVGCDRLAAYGRGDIFPPGPDSARIVFNEDAHPFP